MARVQKQGKRMHLKSSNFFSFLEKSAGSKILSKLRPIRWVESPFFQRPLGLQTRITLLMALVVVGVLAVFSYLDFRLTAHSQREVLRERTIYVTRELDAKILSLKDLEDSALLEKEITNWIYARPAIQGIDIFLFQRKGYKVRFSHRGEKDLGLTREDLQTLKKDLVLSVLTKKGNRSYWEVLAPLHVGRKVVGGVRVLTSLEEAETFLAARRTWTILFTMGSVAVLVLILTFFFSRTVNRPIRRLVRAMSEAEEGRLGVAVPAQSKDELGLLAHHFNRMLHRINQFNEELTQRIDSATRELAQRNEELRLANEALFQAQRQLVQLEKLSVLGQMAATMAHEIGTPLNSISGYIQLMLEEEGNSQLATKRLKIIESQLERLTQTVRNLLQSARMPEPQLQPVDLHPLLENLILLTQPDRTMRGIQLVRQWSPSLSPAAGDPALLQQVFLNLMNNALDAMPHGGILTLGTRSAASLSGNGHLIEVMIRDSGAGMSREVRKRIFDPFFTTKEPGKGGGLGLTICREIIVSHRGQIEIETEEGKGTAIFVQLPVFSKEVG
jgi:two-component system NtrC family sensor kinase